MTQDQGSLYDIVQTSHTVSHTRLRAQWFKNGLVLRSSGLSQNDQIPIPTPFTGYDSFSESVTEAMEIDANHKSQSAGENIAEISHSIPSSPALLDSKFLISDTTMECHKL